jgi:hypothetical protein
MNELYTPTTVEQLNQIVGVNIPFTLYADLKNVNSIDELVNEEMPFRYILLDFERNQNAITGHWLGLALFKDEKINSSEPEYSLSYFDSFGRKVDGEMYTIPKTYIDQYFGSKDLLTNLVKKSAYQKYKVKYIDYNDHKLQSVDTSTCGRYVAAFFKLALRKLNEDYDTEVFYNFLKNIKNQIMDDNIVGSGRKVTYDDIIVMLTNT